MASQKDVALSPGPPGSSVTDESISIFEEILNDDQIQFDIVLESDKFLAFRDIGVYAPSEVVIIPKEKLTGISKAEEEHCEMLGQFLYTAKLVAKREGLLDCGFRVVINDGPDGGQSGDYLHMLLVGGKKLKWPPG